MKINKTNTSEIDRAKKNRGKTNTQREKHIHREKNAYTERKTHTQREKRIHREKNTNKTEENQKNKTHHLTNT